MRKTIVYVDGFNLYYGCLKKTPYKWLDLHSLCTKLLTHNSIVEIKYFTARVAARANDPDKPTRQQTYLRALNTIPNLSIIYGTFLTNPCILPLETPVPGLPRMVTVLRTEEKGSDVNIAAHMLNDGYKGRYEVAVLISNDSDLAEPVRMVREELQKVVGILNPYPQTTKKLKPYTNFIKVIRQGVLAASQFPEELTDLVGTFRKPADW